MRTQNTLFKFSSKIVIVLSLFLLSIASCKKDKVETIDKEYRTIAWNYLSKAEQATVNTKWEDAPVTKPSIEDPKSVSVRFGTNQDALLGPIVVYISIETKAVVRIGLRY